MIENAEEETGNKVKGSGHKGLLSKGMGYSQLHFRGYPIDS